VLASQHTPGERHNVKTRRWASATEAFMEYLLLVMGGFLTDAGTWVGALYDSLSGWHILAIVAVMLALLGVATRFD
jgi:hypothetical protein